MLVCNKISTIYRFCESFDYVGVSLLISIFVIRQRPRQRSLPMPRRRLQQKPPLPRSRKKLPRPLKLRLQRSPNPPKTRLAPTRPRPVQPSKKQRPPKPRPRLKKPNSRRSRPKKQRYVSFGFGIKNDNQHPFITQIDPSSFSIKGCR